MHMKHARQYTIRDVPEDVDRALRRRAKELGKSINRVALEALATAAGQEVQRRDLSFIAGSMSPREADRVDEEVRRQRKIDPDLWR